MKVTSFTVEIHHDGQFGDAFDETFAQYLTLREHPFLEDYAPTDIDSPFRRDGYHQVGPCVHRVIVSPHYGGRYEWSFEGGHVED